MMVATTEAIMEVIRGYMGGCRRYAGYHGGYIVLQRIMLDFFIERT